MKPGLLLSSLLAVAIIVAASFGLHVSPITPIHNIPESLAGAVLYVCPVANTYFSSISKALSLFRQGFMIAFFFFFIIMIAGFGWGLYQNLLKDKFEKKNYEFPWFLAKSLFWLTIIVTILMNMPNTYRSVKLNGASGDFVLCESYSKTSRPVYANAIILPK